MSPQLYSWWGGQQDSFSVYSWVFPKSVCIPGIHLFLQLICMVCGCKGPGYKCHEFKFPKQLEQCLFNTLIQKHTTRNFLCQIGDFSIFLATRNLFKPNKSKAWFQSGAGWAFSKIKLIAKSINLEVYLIQVLTLLVPCLS